MTPQEKAKDLMSKFSIENYMQARAGMPSDWRTRQARRYALKCVDEMLEYENRMLEEWSRYFEGKGGQLKIERLFWNEVKQILTEL